MIVIRDRYRGLLQGSAEITLRGRSVTIPFTLDDETGSFPNPDEETRLIAQWDNCIRTIDWEAVISDIRHTCEPCENCGDTRQVHVHAKSITAYCEEMILSCEWRTRGEEE